MLFFFKYMYMWKLINMDKIYCTNVNNKWDSSFSNHYTIYYWFITYPVPFPGVKINIYFANKNIIYYSAEKFQQTLECKEMKYLRVLKNIYRLTCI